MVHTSQPPARNLWIIKGDFVINFSSVVTILKVSTNGSVVCAYMYVCAVPPSSEIRGLCLMKLDPSKRIIICFIFGIWKSTFFSFSTSYFIFFPNECPDHIMKNWKKSTLSLWLFILQKYGKFLSFWLAHFIKHPIIWRVWYGGWIKKDLLFTGNYVNTPDSSSLIRAVNKHRKYHLHQLF